MALTLSAVLAGSTIAKSTSLLLDCKQGKTNNSVLELLPRAGRSGKPIINTGGQLVLARCDSVTIINMDIRATESYPDADYIVDYLEEEPLRATVSNNIFRNFPRGVFRHTTVNGLTVTGNEFITFGNVGYMLDPLNVGNQFTRSTITVTENDELVVPPTMTISSNTLSNIRYVTFVNIQSTRGSVVINSNACQTGICGWGNDYNITTIPL